jgi:hypothetical protein
MSTRLSKRPYFKLAIVPDLKPETIVLLPTQQRDTTKPIQRWAK